MLESIKQSAAKHREIEYAVLADSSGNILIHTKKPDLSGRSLEPEQMKEYKSIKSMLIREIGAGKGKAIEIIQPIQISTNPWGNLRMVYTLKHLDREILSSRRQIKKETTRMIQKSLLTSLAFLGVSFFIVLFLSTRFTTPLIHLTESARKLSRGDFTQKIDVSQKDEIGVLASAMNHKVKNLSEINKKKIQTSRYLTSSAFDQQASLEQTSALLEKMSGSTKKNVESANKADEFMAETTGVVNRANDIMDSLTDSMNEISKASEESYQIIKTIDEIAFQTNLLSLNAAVEAARAGNAGLEFAVVAGEVKKLAMRSAEAARNTATLIEDTVKKINDGEKLVLRANEGFQEVADYAKKVAELVSEISFSSDEQNKKIDQINEAIAQMNIVTERNVASAKALASSMSIFKVSGRKMLT